MRNFDLLVPISLAFVVGACLPAFADDTGSATTTTSANPSENTSSPTLQGSVVKIEERLNQLRDARLSISRVRKATANLYDEVTRQQVSMGFNPNVVGTTVIMTPMPMFSGPCLPARKKWVVASMDEIGPIINLFKEDVDTAIETDSRADVGSAARKALDPIREKAFASVKTSFELYKQLVGLTAGNTFDNNSIASVTKSLDGQIKQLDRDFKKAIGILQKEAKSDKRA
jgi:hypothetical protein